MNCLRCPFDYQYQKQMVFHPAQKDEGGVNYYDCTCGLFYYPDNCAAPQELRSTDMSHQNCGDTAAIYFDNVQVFWNLRHKFSYICKMDSSGECIWFKYLIPFDIELKQK